MKVVLGCPSQVTTDQNCKARIGRRSTQIIEFANLEIAHLCACFWRYPSLSGRFVGTPKGTPPLFLLGGGSLWHKSI